MAAVTLDRNTVLRALKTPYAPLLTLAFTYVSLSRNEMLCVKGCIVDGETEEAFAERIERSRDFVARHKASGIRRLQHAWARMDAQLLCDMCDYN